MRRVLTILCLASTVFGLPVHANELSSSRPDGSFALYDAIAHIHEHHPALMAARESLKETQELYPQARAGWRPSLNAEASIYHSDIESSNFGTADGTTTKELSLNLDQPLWRGGRTFAETDRAEFLIKAGVATLKQREQDLFLQTASVYMDVLRDQQLLELRKNNEQILLEEMEAVEERYRLGDTTITDVNQSEARYVRAKSNTYSAFQNLYTSEARFEELTKMSGPYSFTMPVPGFVLPDNVEDMVLLAEQFNLELLIAKFEHVAAEENIEAIERELLPQVSAFASYNKQYDPQPGLNDESETRTVGLRATLALYQGGTIRSRTREARYAHKRGEYEIEDIRMQIRQQLNAGLYAYQTAKAESEARALEITASEAALNGVREEARLGQRTILDVLDADEDLINAKIAAVRAQRNHVVAKFQLAATLGLLVMDNLKYIDEN